MNRQLSKAAKFVAVSATATAAQTPISGTAIDMQGYEDITLVAHLGAITATGVATLKAQGGEQSGGGDKQDLEGSAVVADDTMGSKFLVLDIHRPRERYITPVLTRTTANVAVNSIIAILYNGSHVPVTQTDVAAAKSLLSPAEGTA